MASNSDAKQIKLYGLELNILLIIMSEEVCFQNVCFDKHLLLKQTGGDV